MSSGFAGLAGVADTVAIGAGTAGNPGPKLQPGFEVGHDLIGHVAMAEGRAEEGAATRTPFPLRLAALWELGTGVATLGAGSGIFQVVAWNWSLETATWGGPSTPSRQSAQVISQ